MLRALKKLAGWRLAVLLTAGVAAVAASVIASSQPAAASITWRSGSLTFSDTANGRTLASCTSSNATVQPETYANPGGYITSISFSGCSGAGFTITLTASGLSWPVSANPAARTIGQAAGGHGISIKVTATGCTAYVDGTGPQTQSGMVNFTFRPYRRVAVTAGNLHVWDPAGCTIFSNSGDPVSFSVVYTLSAL